MSTDKFPAIIAIARRDAGLTAAEFDYQLNRGPALGRDAYQGLDNAIYTLANAGHPEVTEGAHQVHRDRMARAAQLREQYTAEIDQLIADAKAKSYTGWSDASRGPIRYAR